MFTIANLAITLGLALATSAISLTWGILRARSNPDRMLFPRKARKTLVIGVIIGIVAGLLYVIFGVSWPVSMNFYVMVATAVYMIVMFTFLSTFTMVLGVVYATLVNKRTHTSSDTE